MTATRERPPGGEPEAFQNDTGGASGKDYQEAPTIPRFLEVVYGRGNGWVHLSTTNRQITSYPAANPGPMADIIAGKHDVYLSAAVAGNNAGSGTAGRVEDSDMVELTALWVDIDRVGPGHKTTAPLWTREDMGQLLERLPVGPTAVVDSGGGWWLWFVLAEPVPLNGDGTGELLLARWRRYWVDLADNMGRHIDGVWNPGRIARAPGSVNTKEGGQRPAVLKSLYPNRVYTFDELDRFLPAPEPPRVDWKQHTGDGDRPGDEYNRAATVSSVVALLEAHGFHSPRQIGGRVDLTRPGKSARDGHSVTVWPDASVTFWSSAPEGLPGTITLRDGASGTYDPFGLYAHLEHRGDFQAAARTLNPTPARLVVPTVTAATEDDDGFWDSRPELAHVRDYARAQLAAPYAVLAVVLARVVCRTPPGVVLPAVIYSYASLNLTIALVADSGGGKGGAVAVGREAVEVGPLDFKEHSLGSGQGIAHAYAHTEKGELVRHATSVLFTVEEVDHLAAHNAQNGSTVLAELRRFGMGEKLGHLYVDSRRRVEVPAHEYRGAVIVAIQPARAGVILGAQDGGTPQRFFWAPTTDPNRPATRPNRPEPIRWTPPRIGDLPTERGLRPIPVCDTAAVEIIQAQLDRTAGTGDPLDGHALLTRERLAAALGILNGRYGVDEEDWQLAGHLMRVSDATRTHVAEVLADRDRQTNRQRGEREAERSVIVKEAVTEAALQRVAQGIGRHLPATGTISRKELRHKFSSDDRGYFDEAAARAAAAGVLEVVETEKGTHYRKAEK